MRLSVGWLVPLDEACSKLNKTLYLLNYLWIWKTFCKSVQSLTVGWKLAFLATLPSCGMPLVRGRVRYSSMAAFWPFAHSMCSVSAGEGLSCFTVSSAFCPKGSSAKSDSRAPTPSDGPPSRQATLGLCNGSMGLWRIMLLAAGSVRYLQAPFFLACASLQWYVWLVVLLGAKGGKGRDFSD